jgi:Flp pilus assembly protein TadG
MNWAVTWKTPIKLGLKLAGKYLRSRRGNIAAMTALLTVPICGMIGLAVEATNWYLVQRGAQNAADSAAIAAAINGSLGGSNTSYTTEAQSVAAQYGFTASNSTVAVTYGTFAYVPDCVSTNCYKVTITRTVPIYFLRAVGYNGTGGSGRQTVVASSIAEQSPSNAPFCVEALSNTDPAIRTNGCSKCNLSCNAMSQGNATCNGGSLTDGYFFTHGTVKNGPCGVSDTTNATLPADPYAALASNIPGDVCSSGAWSGTLNPGVNKVVGDVKLTGNITVNSDSVLYICNGSLNLNGKTLKTATGTSAGLTIVFTGSGASNFVTGNGILDISSPQQGTTLTDWKGIAIYQDPKLTVSSSTYTGNSPEFDISGVVYLPRTDLTMKGAIKQSDSGYKCLTLVTNTLVLSGTGSIFSDNQSECSQQGVTQIYDTAGMTGKLIY